MLQNRIPAFTRRWMAALFLLLLMLLLKPGSSFAAGETAVVSTGVLNVRSGPGTGYDVVQQVFSGDRLPLLDRSGDWVKVQLAAGGTGWVAGWLVKIRAAAPPLSETGSGTQPPAPAQNEVAVVTGGQVNIRSGPNTSYALVTMVARGARLPILGKSGSWYKVA
ncbi:MAG: SH3 domain-containing protein, partial [Peptococcaceae bacterium]|nr:SH3 domain-containing protein [Peptococcaceae bacterium]